MASPELARECVGIEYDAAACATRAAAGHLTIRADVTTLDAATYRGKVEGLIASPPCPDFSAAGRRAGIEGATGRLMREVPRWAEAVRPRWIACEQVPPALEWWEAYAAEMRAWGYRTWAGVLNAADFGVPQTRRRAFLLASLDRQPHPPEPTHARCPAPALFGGELAPWVSMAEALGWGGRWRMGFPRKDDRGDSEDGYRERDWRGEDEPAFALTEKARSWAWTRPAPTIVANRRSEDGTLAGRQLPDGEATNVGGWNWRDRDRPATTVAGDPRLWPPGHKVNGDDRRRLGDDAANERYGDRAGTEAIRLTLEDALVLQSFRADYPVQGTKTKQFEQVGNAVPPLLARRVLEAVIG